MGFDLTKFETEQYRHRESVIAVPALAKFFTEGEKAEWKVRGLTGIEIAKVRESKKRAQNIEGLIERIASNVLSEKVTAVMDALGIDADSPDDYVQRLTMLEIGSVSPKIRRPHAVKLADVSPIEFHRLTDEIMNLTGQGKLGESSASGTTPESGQASPLPPEADSQGAGSDTSTK
jgi:hypothetical protein